MSIFDITTCPEGNNRVTNLRVNHQRQLYQTNCLDYHPLTVPQLLPPIENFNNESVGDIAASGTDSTGFGTGTTVGTPDSISANNVSPILEKYLSDPFRSVWHGHFQLQLWTFQVVTQHHQQVTSTGKGIPQAPHYHAPTQTPGSHFATAQLYDP